MKTSGSKRSHLINGSYADERHTKRYEGVEDLPKYERIKSTGQFYNGKINYGLLVRFLRGKTGQNWDDVYSKIIERIPTKLLDYKEMIFWFVADKVEFVDGQLYNRKSQRFIFTGEQEIAPLHFTERKYAQERIEFYVDPSTRKLVHIPQLSAKRIRKKA